ncbi:hypothetical protein DIPPA_60806 [Diplonema papillatum]|nr:hypothetical protein DIPPA_60806 [Diplonema papillatum]
MFLLQMFVSIGTTACLEYREGSALGNLVCDSGSGYAAVDTEAGCDRVAAAIGIVTTKFYYLVVQGCYLVGGTPGWNYGGNYTCGANCFAACIQDCLYCNGTCTNSCACSGQTTAPELNLSTQAPSTQSPLTLTTAPPEEPTKSPPIMPPIAEYPPLGDGYEEFTIEVQKRAVSPDGDTTPDTTPGTTPGTGSKGNSTSTSDSQAQEVLAVLPYALVGCAAVSLMVLNYRWRSLG